MSQQYKRMRVRRYAPVDVFDNPEARYWKKFKHPVVATHFSAVSSIHFSPVEPHDFAVTTSTRVVLYDSKTNRSRRAISRFKDVAYSGSYRADGKLIVAGCKDSTVKVFEQKSKTLLRMYRGHKGPVQVTKFSGDKVHVLSASDDKTIRYWDLTSERPLHVVNAAHKDHIRCASNSPSTPAVWITGGYDHKVKVWDMRALRGGSSDGTASGAGAGAGAGAGSTSVSSSSNCSIKFDHGAPVEDVCVLPGGNAVVTAGGNELKVWDLIAGKLLRTLSNHQKTITAVALDGTGTRLLSGSLDHHVKVYSLDTFAVMHGLKYASPVLSVACSPNNSRLVVGMSDGSLDIRQRSVKLSESVAAKKVAKSMFGGTYRYFMRGKSSAADASDFKVQVSRKPKLQPYDVHLKKFEHRKALDAALQTRHPVVVVSLFEELVQRDCLVAALSGRDEAALEPLLAFLVKYVAHPKYAATLVDVANATFDLYAPVLGRSVAIDDLFLRMQAAVRRELRFEQELFQLQGCLDLILSAR